MAYYKLIPDIPSNKQSEPATHWIDTSKDGDLNYNIMRNQLMYDIEDVEVIEIDFGEFEGRRGHKKKL
jgi:hypothetical protein|tara:strand:+ start:69 stop:272 length:204 start_codon:yes stop_codon:yes gene_type:complete